MDLKKKNCSNTDKSEMCRLHSATCFCNSKSVKVSSIETFAISKEGDVLKYFNTSEEVQSFIEKGEDYFEILTRQDYKSPLFVLHRSSPKQYYIHSLDPRMIVRDHRMIAYVYDITLVKTVLDALNKKKKELQ
jgi:hypothetical protein